MKKGKIPFYQTVSEPNPKKNKVKIEKKKTVNTYLVMGFKAVPRAHADTYALEVINSILGRGQSGRMFTEIRSKMGLAYDVGTQCVSEASFGYFAVYATIDKKNVQLVKKLILQEIQKLKEISLKDLQEAKDYIEGDYLLSLEESQKVADQLLFWEQSQKAEFMKKYLSQIRKVTISDVHRVTTKYFKNYTMVVIEGK